MPFVVVSDVIETTDTSVHAHVRLPAAAWGEKGGTVTNSDRTISRQRAFMAAPGEAKPDWWIVSEVGRRMGWKTAFSYDRSAEIWREHCRLSSYENDSARLFALPGHAAKGNAEYDAMTPFRWGGAPFADGRFSTPDGRARLVPVVQKPVASPLTQWPMTPNTGRYRDQWHTMTRTGLSPKLARHREEPLVEIYPTTQYGWGSSMAAWRACNHAAGQQHLPRDRRRDAEGPRTVRADPLDRPYRYRRLCRGAPPPGRRPNLGSAGLKSTPVRIEPIATEWRGFVVVRGELATRPDCLWATRVAVPGGTAWDMAGNGDAAALDALLPKGQRIEAIDAARGSRRIAILESGKLAAVLFVTRDGMLPPRDWLVAQLSEAIAAPTLLAGRAPGVQIDRGPIVCACFDFGLKTIVAAIADQHLADVHAIGAALKAGTNCGSCCPALAKLLVTQGSANVA